MRPTRCSTRESVTHDRAIDSLAAPEPLDVPLGAQAVPAESGASGGSAGGPSPPPSSIGRAMANHVVALPAPAVLRQPGRFARARRAVWLFCRRTPLGACGCLLVLLLSFTAIFADWLAPYPYDETIRGARMKPPSAQFLMGTDNLGRDVFSRVVYGARVSVSVGFGAVLIANCLAALIGITSG